MACHLAGVTTAVATCGTAFGVDHIAVLRRLLMDADTFGSKVIFTFDGDAAGRKAAERAFADEQKFVAQTYVAIEASGKDPCELRQAGGDAAVRALVAGAVPLLEFVLASTVERFDRDTVDGQAAALDAGIPLVASLKDRSRQDLFARKLAGLVGVDDPNRVAARVRGYQRATAQSAGGSAGPAAAPADPVVPPKLAALEREVLKSALQLPATVGATFDGFGEDAFLVPLHRELAGAIARCGGASGAVAGPEWTERVTAELADGTAAREAVVALTVEPLRERPEHQDRYAAAVVTSLAEKIMAREIAQLRSRMQRLSAADDHAGAGEVMIKLIDLERSHRELRAMAIGGE
jgi:DNA primase